jgi:hypothetical protein
MSVTRRQRTLKPTGEIRPTNCSNVDKVFQPEPLPKNSFDLVVWALNKPKPQAQSKKVFLLRAGRPRFFFRKRSSHPCLGGLPKILA